MAMSETTSLKIEIPADWAVLLADRTKLMQVLTLGLEEYRIRHALTLYQAGGVSIGYAAQEAGIPVSLLMDEGRQRGVVPNFDEVHFDRDIDA